jgi:hypothetical protein
MRRSGEPSTDRCGGLFDWIPYYRWKYIQRRIDVAQPIYKVFFINYKEPYYKLTTEERNKLGEQDEASLKQVGAVHLISCVSMGFNEEWLGWGVEKYPDMEAVQKHTENLYNLNWFEYFETKTYLGTELPPT